MEEQVTKKQRKAAPNVIVEDVFRDDRQSILAQLDGQDKDAVHSFQSGSANPDELRRKGLEPVKNADGSLVMHGSDMVVRCPKELHDKRKARESAESFEISQRRVKDPDEIRQFRKVKKPKIRRENSEEE